VIKIVVDLAGKRGHKFTLVRAVERNFGVISPKNFWFMT
jgi:hypothetical protein